MPRQDRLVRTQSMIFTVYGDYVRYRGGEIWVGSLIRLMKELGFSEQAVRSALSRMCQRGWLQRVKVGKRSFYSMTPTSSRLLEEGAQRIYYFQQRARQWDGRWHVITYSIPERKRGVREKLRKELTWLGYGALSYGTWISPHNSRREVERVVQELKVKRFVEVFSARHEGFATSQELVSRCWNLEEINRRYAAFLDKYRPRYQSFLHRLQNGEEVPPAECFVERVMLIHEYRKFPFFDPEIPQELWPEGWLAGEAAKLFENYHRLLEPKANAFFDAVYRNKW